MNWLEFLKNIDRRVIYALMFLSIIVPLYKPMGLPVPATGPVKDIYNRIERLKPGDKVILSFDYDPGSQAEVHPMAMALIRHLWTRDVKIVAIALWPVGPSLADGAFEEVLDDPDHNFRKTKKYGVDYVNMGYLAGPTLGYTQVASFCSSLAKARPEDDRGNAIDDFEKLPIMDGVKNVKTGVELVVSLSSGDPGVPAWVEIANSRYSVEVAAGATAVQAPQFYPYIQSKQLFGFMGGLRGAAEYETLLKDNKITPKPGRATQGMEAQSYAHLLIMALIIIANIMYLWEMHQQNKK